MTSLEHIIEAELLINRAQNQTGSNALVLSNLAVAHSNLAVAERMSEIQLANA
jgi:hypothetical protein